VLSVYDEEGRRDGLHHPCPSFPSSVVLAAGGLGVGVAVAILLGMTFVRQWRY
jgi:hypothetical protein